MSLTPFTPRLSLHSFHSSHTHSTIHDSPALEMPVREVLLLDDVHVNHKSEDGDPHDGCDVEELRPHALHQPYPGVHAYERTTSVHMPWHLPWT